MQESSIEELLTIDNEELISIGIQYTHRKDSPVEELPNARLWTSLSTKRHRLSPIRNSIQLSSHLLFFLLFLLCSIVHLFC